MWDLQTPPTVKAIALNAPAVGDAYERGETIRARVAFDLEVDVTGSPQLALRIGSNTRQASYVEFDDPAHPGYRRRTESLLFRYELVQADVDPDGISIAADALTLNGGTITFSGH